MSGLGLSATSVSIWLQNGVLTDAGGVGGAAQGPGGSARGSSLWIWSQGRESARFASAGSTHYIVH